MCEGGSRRLVQCGGNAGLRPGWAPGQHWAKERLGEKVESLLYYQVLRYCFFFTGSLLHTLLLLIMYFFKYFFIIPFYN